MARVLVQVESGGGDVWAKTPGLYQDREWHHWHGAGTRAGKKAQAPTWFFSSESPGSGGEARTGPLPFESLLNVAVTLRLDRNLIAASPGAIRRDRDDERENDEGERDADHLCIWGIQGSTQSEEPEDQHHQAQERDALPLG